MTILYLPKALRSTSLQPMAEYIGAVVTHTNTELLISAPFNLRQHVPAYSVLYVDDAPSLLRHQHELVYNIYAPLFLNEIWNPYRLKLLMQDVSIECFFPESSPPSSRICLMPTSQHVSAPSST